MRLVVLGSGDAFNAEGRGHSCYLLDDHGGAPVMVDFGGTALAALRRLGRSPHEIGAVFLTHLHGDHFGGLPFLLIDSVFNVPARHHPLTIVGPPNTEQRVGDLYRLSYGLAADHARPYPLSYVELDPAAAPATVEGIEIEAHLAHHTPPPDLSLCLRLKWPSGRVIAFSGDTQPCEGLFRAARGADLLVAECSAMRRPWGPHTTWEDWLEILPRLDCARVLLAHAGGDVRRELPSQLASLRLGVNVELADDGAVISLEP